jgi:preprotein translocase subunit SecY
MWEKIRVIFTIPELRQKIFLTLLFLAIYRVGWQIPLPMIDQEAMSEAFGQSSGFSELLNRVSTFSASQLSQATIFGLGIMPYISASIIFQLLGSVWKPIEELQKEGETGRKKINEYTRYLTVVLCLVQSWAYVSYIASQESIIYDSFAVNGVMTFWWKLTAVLTMTCGTIS